MKELRLTAAQRITGVIWGLIVAGAAVTAMVALSGTDVELVNVIIVALAALGTWLLASALAAARPRKANRPDAAVTDAPTTAGASATDETTT
jgi:hypothetical protein